MGEVSSLFIETNQMSIVISWNLLNKRKNLVLRYRKKYILVFIQLYKKKKILNSENEMH